MCKTLSITIQKLYLPEIWKYPDFYLPPASPAVIDTPVNTGRDYRQFFDMPMAVV